MSTYYVIILILLTTSTRKAQQLIYIDSVQCAMALKNIKNHVSTRETLHFFALQQVQQQRRFSSLENKEEPNEMSPYLYEEDAPLNRTSTFNVIWEASQKERKTNLNHNECLSLQLRRKFSHPDIPLGKCKFPSVSSCQLIKRPSTGNN